MKLTHQPNALSIVGFFQELMANTPDFNNIIVDFVIIFIFDAISFFFLVRCFCAFLSIKCLIFELKLTKFSKTYASYKEVGVLLIETDIFFDTYLFLLYFLQCNSLQFSLNGQ